MRKWTANLISLSRLALIVPWAICQAKGSALAFPIMCLIIVTDMVDGRVARRLSVAGELGAYIDACSDLLVCTLAMFVLAMDDPRYLLVPCAMAAAFLSWLALRWRRGRLAYTRLGKYNGALCYALAAFGSAGLSLEGWGGMPLLIGAALYLAVSAVENIAGTFGPSDGLDLEQKERPTLKTDEKFVNSG